MDQKDSFDKLLDLRPILRENNVLKKEVHASYNLNSSIDNCSKEDSSLLVPPTFAIELLKKRKKRHVSVSTPNRASANPFRCSLSPIGTFKFRFFENKEKNQDQENFQATAINSNIVEYDFETQQESRNNLIQKSFSPLPLRIVPKSKNTKHVCFASTQPETTQQDKVKSSTGSENAQFNTECKEQHKERRTSVMLHTGKWRKSLNVWRRANLRITERKSSNVNQIFNHNESSTVELVAVLPVSGRRKSAFIKTERRTTSVQNKSHCFNSETDWERQVLQRCAQQMVVDFNELYSADNLKNCRKIGEGSYGEVFLKSISEVNTDKTVIKVIPIEGTLEINGEVQKTFEQIWPEIVISTELSRLEDMKENSTNGFVNVKRTSCVRGKYPDHLVKLWKDYDELKGSENDDPQIFASEQLYIVLELEFCGSELAEFVFNNAEQTYYALQQIILTLAVGEKAFEFEHRDLHWGNVLIINTSEKHVCYKINNIELTVPTKGVKITIIDYTLSRMTFDDCCLYNDLSTDDELFLATGDYQFDIYRMMRDVLKNNWEKYEPKTNVFWISYIVDKLLDGVKYKNKQTKTHASYMKKLQKFKAIALEFDCAADCAKHFKKIN